MSLETKVLYKKKLDKELTVKVSQNDASERIFVEFSSKDGKLIIQKSFQNTYDGRNKAKTFEDSFKTVEEFRSHLKLK